MSTDEARTALAKLSFYDQMRIAADIVHFASKRYLDSVHSTANPEYEAWSPDCIREYADTWEQKDGT